MDKNKIKEALKSKLKQEMSMTSTGASVTSGAGEGVATKYAFGKSTGGGTPKDWKEAPSIPNRKSKAMDYKELWEFDATSFFQGQMVQQAMQSAPQAMSEAEKIITYVLMGIGVGAVGGGLAAIVKDKLGSLNPIPAIKHWFSDRQKRKALEPIVAKLKQDPEVMKYVANKNLRGIQTVIKNKLSPEEQKYIGSLTRDALSESMDYKELWEGENEEFLSKLKNLDKLDQKEKTLVLSRVHNLPKGALKPSFKKERHGYSVKYTHPKTGSLTTGFLSQSRIDNFLNGTVKLKEENELQEIADALGEAYIPSTTNVEELARVEELLAQAYKDNTYSVMSSYEFIIKALRLLVGLEKKYKTTLPLLKFSMSFIDYLQKYFPGFKGKFGPYNQKWRSVYDHIDQSLSQKQNMNEENIEEAYVPDNIKKFAQRKGVSNIVSQVARWAEKAGKSIVGGTAIGKDYSTLILDLTYQGGEIRINTDTDEIEVKGEEVYDYNSFVNALSDESINEIDTNDSSTDEILTYLQAAKQQGKLSPDAQQVLIQWMNSPGASREEIIKVLRQLTGMYLNENYARFRNETKTRTKPEQFHNAVKSVKQKVNEINRLFEYMNRLQSELSESEGGLKHKKYTDKAIQSIKESTKQLFFKSTKLK